MQRLERRDPEAMKLWVTILKSRVETGEPYIMYKDNVNNANPPAYVKNNLDVSMTNICSEINYILTKSIALFVVYHQLILQNGMNGKTQIL